ncbi:FUSC family protein [Streptomyces daliensis]
MRAAREAGGAGKGKGTAKAGPQQERQGQHERQEQQQGQGQQEPMVRQGRSVAERWQAALRAPGRLWRGLKRAKEHSGPERDTLFLLFKSAVAGVLAWALAQYAFASPQPTYAPFTALLVVQSTAYRSLLQSVRYVIAVVLGVLAAGAVGPTLGENAAAFAVMLGLTLAVGRWNRLGSQGIQVSVAGVFAYNALSGTHEQMLWQIILMALLGAGVGIAVTLLLLPPLRYRAATQGVHEISHTVATLLNDIARGLGEGLPERDVVADWLHRARRLDASVDSARYAVESGAESVVYNPRRLLPRNTLPTSFAGYRTFVEALARASEQIRSICYGLLRIIDDESGPTPGDDFLCPYADLLGTLSRAVGQIGAHEDGQHRRNPFDQALEDGRARHRELTAAAEGTAAWASHGVLLTDADRLIEEFAHAHSQGAVQPHPEHHKD